MSLNKEGKVMLVLANERVFYTILKFGTRSLIIYLVLVEVVMGGKSIETNIKEKIGSLDNLVADIRSGASSKDLIKKYKISYDTQIKYIKMTNSDNLGIFLQNNKKAMKEAKLPNVNLHILKNLIMAGFGKIAISRELNISPYLTYRFAAKIGLLDKLKDNARASQYSSNYKGLNSTFRKYKKTACERCGSTKNLHLHHIDPGEYDEYKSTFVKVDHSPENLLTVCASCHLKIHYRELGRKPVPSNGRTFFKRNLKC